MRTGNHTCASRNSEHNMQIYLRVGIRHFAQLHMTLQAELIRYDAAEL